MPQFTRTIGIYGEAQQEIVQRAVAGLLRYCEEVEGLTVRDFRLREMIEDVRQTPPWRGRADGVILAMGVGAVPAKALADWVVRAGVPAVHLGHDWADPRVPAVFMKPASLAEIAAAHLVECQCKSYLYVGYASSEGSMSRGKAFLKAIEKRGRRGVDYPMADLLLGSYEDEMKARADAGLVELLQNLSAPIGIMALNDNYATAIVRVCGQLGLAVPDQVKVVGVDDLAIGRINRPSITSVRTPREEIGYVAAKSLHQLMDRHPGVPQTTELPATELSIRQSTSGPSVAPGSLTDVLEHIRRHACDGVSVSELVEIMGVSRRSFETWFRQRVGRSPGEEIQRVRLERARDLLSRSDLSLSQVASMTGFAEAAAFSKFFRREQGESPRSYRHSTRDVGEGI